MPQHGNKLALPGLRHSVEWWGLPTRLEWALAPDRGALGYQTGSFAARMAFRRLRGPWVQVFKSSSLLHKDSGCTVRTLYVVFFVHWQTSLGYQLCKETVRSCLIWCGRYEAGGQNPGRVPWVTPLGLPFAARCKWFPTPSACPSLRSLLAYRMGP